MHNTRKSDETCSPNQTGSLRHLIVDCTGLRAGSIDTITVLEQLVLEDPAVGTSEVFDSTVSVDATIEATSDTLIAIGRVEGIWVSKCRRCLGEVQGRLDISLNEVFEDDPEEGETWPIAVTRINLSPPIREAALLSLPLNPLCSTECCGPVPDRFPTGPALSAETNTEDQPTTEKRINPVWAALNEITFQD